MTVFHRLMKPSGPRVSPRPHAFPVGIARSTPAEGSSQNINRAKSILTFLTK